jgi:alpha-N-acetylgalactosaminidase
MEKQPALVSRLLMGLVLLGSLQLGQRRVAVALEQEPSHGDWSGLAKTPPMGWLSWERFTCTIDCEQFPDDCINSRLYKSMADRLVDDGYAQLGYQYVNIDDCWSELERDPESGNLVANASRFPEGIHGLAEYIHSRNLKLGIYGDCGTATCAGYPAQLKSEQDLEDNHFDLDAKRLAEWQVDSFKFDGCYLDPAKAESICPKMWHAIAAQGRPMIVTCEWPFYMLRENYQHNKMLKPDFKMAQQVCHAWRYYEDVEDSWQSVLSIVDFTVRIQSIIVKFHGPGHWFDPDQLVVGNFALSLDQARAQMAIWCVWSAPLYMSNDLRNIDPAMADVLKNRQLIEVNQDRLGIFGLMVASQDSGRYQAFVKPVEPIRSGCPSFVVVYLSRHTLGNKSFVSFKLRELLLGVDYDLVAKRYGDPMASYWSTNLSPLLANCKQFISSAMSRDPKENELLNRPIQYNNDSNEPKLEHKQVYFEVIDLFGDDPHPRPVALNGQLTLRVNPSGVRAVKLVQV